MYWAGRLLQVIGLAVTGIGCLVAFNPATPERHFWSYALAGMMVFLIGHAMIPKR